jgi:hypothetical protein
MNRLFIAGAIVAALVSAPLAVAPRRAEAPPSAPETVSMPDLVPVKKAPTLSEMDLRPAWAACVALSLAGRPVPSGAGDRFVEAFFDGRLPAAAPFVRRTLSAIEAPEAAKLASRARAFDRSLVALRPAPSALLRVFVERVEDAEAHLEATRANVEGITALVSDPAIGERAFGLLLAAGVVTPPALRILGEKVAQDPWVRRALGSLGERSVPVLLEALDSADARRRAAAAWVLAGLGPEHADRILQTVLPDLARDAVSGNAGFAVRALTALGERARPAVRGLLKSGDDQAVAAALQVLMRTGGATAAELEDARPRVERLAARAGEAGDEASIGIELRTSLGVAPVADPPARLNPSQTGSSAPGRDLR